MSRSNDIIRETIENLDYFSSITNKAECVRYYHQAFSPFINLSFPSNTQTSSLSKSGRQTDRIMGENMINEKARPREDYISNTGPNEFKRSGLENLGNTCYLNATLQVLRNSLTFSPGVPNNANHFTKLLMDFYMGDGRVPNAILDYLEQHLKVNLRKQSDAATYMDTICQMLEAEGSTMVLKKLELSIAPVEWQCQKCNNSIADPRKMKPSYSLILPESSSNYHSDFLSVIKSAFVFHRQKKCTTCNRETDQRGTRQLLNVNHLVLVPQSPKTMNFQIPNIKGFIMLQMEYKLIGLVLHSGPGGAQWFFGGHYIALVKDGHKWFACNDSYVYEVSSDLYEFRHQTPTVMVYAGQCLGKS